MIDETAYMSIECNSGCMIHSFGRCGSLSDNALESSDLMIVQIQIWTRLSFSFFPSRVAQAPAACPTILPKQRVLF